MYKRTHRQLFALQQACTSSPFKPNPNLGLTTLYTKKSTTIFVCWSAPAMSWSSCFWEAFHSHPHLLSSGSCLRNSRKHPAACLSASEHKYWASYHLEKIHISAQRHIQHNFWKLLVYSYKLERWKYTWLLTARTLILQIQPCSVLKYEEQEEVSVWEYQLSLFH